MSRHYLPLCLFFAALLFGLQAHADSILVGGTGASAPLIEKLAAAYLKATPGDTIRLIAPPLGSSGALRALAAGKLDIAISGRPLKTDEQAAAGTAFEWVRTPLVLATRGGTRTAGFSTAELVDVYAGRLTRWADGSVIRLVLRSPYESDTLLLRTLSPQMNVVMDQALARQGMVIAENDLDTLDLLEKTPGALGPVTLGLLRLRDSSLQVLPLDGRLPSATALATGHYRLGKSMYVVGSKAPTQAAQRFLDFLRSAAAQTLLQSYEFLPAF